MSNIDAEKAASFFYDHYDCVHTHTMGGSMQFGADWDRSTAVEFLRKAVKIELHPYQDHRLIAWDTPTHCIAFEVDLKKVDAFLSQQKGLAPMNDNYAVWRAELAGNIEDHQNVDTNIDGYWRLRGAKTKTDFPVAIWHTREAGIVVLRIGNKDINHDDTEWHEFIGGGWLHCTAVPKAEYDAARATGFWPADGKPAKQMSEEAKLGIEVATGGNNPPIEESLADQIKVLAETLDKTAEPTTQEAANELSGKLDRMRSLLKLAEAERVKLKEPHLIASRAVDAAWAEIKAPGEQAGIAAEARRKAYLKKEQARLDAEAAAERKRQQDLVDAENKRIAAENERIREENRKRGAEAAELDQPVEFVPLVAPVSAPVVEAPRAKAGSAYGRSTGLRKVTIAVVTDAALLTKHLLDINDAGLAEYLQTRASQALRGKITLPGVETKEELQ